MSNDDLEFLASLQLDFIGEATEALDKCEFCLLTYEKQKTTESIESYLRHLNFIKGGAYAVELEKIAKAISKVEGLGNKPETDQFIEISLSSIDIIRDAIVLIRTRELTRMDGMLDEVMAKIP